VTAIGLVALAAAAALFAALGWRSERSRRAGLERELALLRDELDSLREAAQGRARAGRERGDELGELRRKLEKARKRAFTATEEKAPLEARAAELEAKLRARDLEAARLRGQVALLEAEQERATREGARLREQHARAVQAAATVRIDPGEHRQLAQRSEAAEQEVRRLAGLLRDSEREAGRYRQRERVQRRAYTVLRGELDVAKDRIRALQGLPGEEPAAGDGAELGPD
jgi:chromosome segregation ATPase